MVSLPDFLSLFINNYFPNDFLLVLTSLHVFAFWSIRRCLCPGFTHFIFLVLRESFTLGPSSLFLRSGHFGPTTPFSFGLLLWRLIDFIITIGRWTRIPFPFKHDRTRSLFIPPHICSFILFLILFSFQFPIFSLVFLANSV